MAAIKNQLDQEYDRAGRENENRPEQVLTSAENLIARSKAKKEKQAKPKQPRAKVSEVEKIQEA